MNWGNLQSSAIPTANTIATLGISGLGKISNLIKFEIVRDFWQIVSLFFEGLGTALPDSFKQFFGNFSVTFSFCFSCWVNKDDVQKWISIIVFIVETLTALICYFIFLSIRKDPNEKVYCFAFFLYTVRCVLKT